MTKLPVNKPKCATPTGRTINLAKECLSAEDRKTKLLIYEKNKIPAIEKPSCQLKLPVGVTTCPKNLKKIRMCTAHDMKSTCPPPMCTCPPLKPPLTTFQILMKGVIFGLKTGIVGGLIYTTYRLGVWGTAKDSECVWLSMKNTILGKEPREDDGSPQVDRTFFSLGENWNYYISQSFCFISCISKKFLSTGASAPCTEPGGIQSKQKPVEKDPCCCK